MQSRVKLLLKDLERFSNTQPDPLSNPASQQITWTYFFANDINFEKSIEYVENAPLLKNKGDALRVAVLVGESYFLSLLPELQKHVDGVIIVDIDDKVLKHCLFLQALMGLSSDTENFVSLYFLMNIIVRENWSIPCFDPKTKRKINEIPPNAEYATKLMMVSGELLEEKHFLHTDSRFFRCQESFEKMFFSFVKLDLFNAEAVKQFQAILQKHQAIISILNLTNLADYDDNFPLLDLNKKLSPPVKFHENLNILCSANLEPTILYSRSDRATNYDKVTSCQTSSVSKYIEQIKSYYEELKLYAKGISEITRGMKYAGEYGRIFSGKSKTPEVTSHGNGVKHLHEAHKIGNF